jgi:SAM-dependent methyltransferase
VGEYKAEAYWDGVGREVLHRRGTGQSSIASDDTPYAGVRQSRFFDEFLDPALEDVQTVLEVGPGPGGNLLRLRAQGKTVFGADVSNVMIDLARRNGLDCLVQIDGEHLPFKDRFCDAVFTSTVLQHNTKEQAVKLLAEIARVASKEVHLFEDTALIPFRDRRSHWFRPPSWYVSLVEAHGYELIFQARMTHTFQEMTAAFARMLAERQRAQGASPTKRRLRLEELLIRAARPVDRHVPPAAGLTRMSFRRTAS